MRPRRALVLIALVVALLASLACGGPYEPEPCPVVYQGHATGPDGEPGPAVSVGLCVGPTPRVP